MGTVLNTRYYVQLKADALDTQDIKYIENKKVEQIVRHRTLGYVVKVYESDIQQIKETGVIRLCVWPDGDSYMFIGEFKIDGIYKEVVTLEEV